MPAQDPQSPITAIDILLEPDATMLGYAQANNARLLEVFPKGFALDDAHRPHITLIQRFVRTADLDKVYAAAEKVLAGASFTRMQLEAFKYYYAPGKDTGVAGIVARPTPALLTLQQILIAAVAHLPWRPGRSARSPRRTTIPPTTPCSSATCLPSFRSKPATSSVRTSAPASHPGITSTRCSPSRLRPSPSHPQGRLCTSSARSARLRRNSRNGI